MNHPNHDQIMDYLNGTLPDEDMQAFEQRILADSIFAELVFEAEETLCQLGIAIDSELQPDEALKSRLLQSVQYASTFENFASKVAELCDISVQTAQRCLDQIVNVKSWAEYLPGMHYLDIPSGPRLASPLHAGLVHLEAGGKFPHHRHLGPETTFVLQGTVSYSDGRIGKPGDVIEMDDNSQHSYQAGDEEALVFLTILGEIEIP